MTPEQLFAFANFAFVSSVTPGPNNVLLTAVGGSVGIRKGMPVLWGIVFGFATMLFLLGLGVGKTLFSIPYVMQGMQVAGFAVLLWLSWKIATAPVGTPEKPAGTPDHGGRGSFVGAALFQWMNPKAWLIAAVAISVYMNTETPVLTQAATFSGVFIGAAILGCLPWLAFGAIVGRYLRDPRIARSFNIVMALLLIGSMVLVILE
ncbi:LysE family translocator [Stappia sp.]|jgi:threonine/homoserine/homoserine lactone efflux protein|uniref:LysE family translocator n=1 Tax=Stappia sp. TaxID=1870903 RepID=UPI003A98DB21